jgi:ribonuclease HI
MHGQPRLGAAVVHAPTSTILYIDARGTKQTRNIMRAELVAIHTALDELATYEWVGIFADSLSNVQAIRHHYTHQGLSSPQNYYHHFLL